jgi:hypothetical protein
MIATAGGSTSNFPQKFRTNAKLDKYRSFPEKISLPAEQ